MAITIAATQGSIDKDVTAAHVMSTQGGSWKEVQNGYVAATQGSIDKQFYANWTYHTGIILNTSSGSGTASSSLNPATSESIRLQKCYTSLSGECDLSANATLHLEWWDGSNWISLGSQTKTMYEGGTYSFYVSATLSDPENYETTQIRARYVKNYGDTAYYTSFQIRCTEWWAQG